MSISLIIPAYNASQYLREALDSVLNQTSAPRQIIVVDDGSTDDTLEIAHSYGNAVTVIEQANAGTAAARNRGLAEADQPMLAFLDQDDRFVSHKLERQMQALLEHPAAMLCCCRVAAFWSQEVPDTARESADLTPQFRFGQPGSWLARRELFEHVGVFSIEPECYLIEGSELFSRIEYSRCQVAKIDDVLLERRLHASNKTANSNAHLDGIMNLMKRRLELQRALE